ncbi:hypothetical protein [Pseudomonas jilinensis]|nr:hypothetical protein [Pseudomonas jilinensis]
MSRKRMLFWSGFFGVALVIALIPEWLFDDTDRSSPELERSASGDVAEALADFALPVLSPENQQSGQPDLSQVPLRDLFASRSWYVAPAPVAAPAVRPQVAAPVQMAAPPMPYRFIGRMVDDGQLKVFLLRDDTLYVVSPGDVIDGLYRVEGLVGDQLQLLYLPMDLSQSLTVGSRL